MPQQAANKEFNTFVKGIITEASPLTFPENASIDEQNFVLNRDGSRQRRLGIDYESESSLIDSGLDASDFKDIGISTHLWQNINEDPTLSFYIVQISKDLYFFDALRSPSSNFPKNGGNIITLPGDGNLKWQSTSLGGRVVFVTGDNDIFTLEYDEGTDTISFVRSGLLTRDVWGIDDGLFTDERPRTLSDTHRYNLLNQGWGGDDPDSIVTHYDQFKIDSGTDRFPSNSDLVHLGKNATEDQKFFPELVARSFFGNTPSPKGHHILNVFDRSSSRELSAPNVGLLNNYTLNAGSSISSGLWGL